MDEREVEERVDALYAAPLDAFVRERDALAKELKKDHKARAAEVKKLARPTAAAWAVNQIYRRHRAAFDALLAAGEALRDAQRTALAGGGAAGLKAALAARTTHVRGLVALARAELGAGGGAAAPAALARVEATLNAITTSPQPFALGRLAADVEVDAMEALVALGPADLPPRTPSLAREPVVDPEHAAARAQEATPAARANASPAAEPARRSPSPTPTERERARRIEEAERRVAASLAEVAARTTAVKAAETARADARRMRDAATARVEGATRALRADEEALAKARAVLREAEQLLDASEAAVGSADGVVADAERAAIAAKEAADRARDALAQARGDDASRS